jgi:hypothetical protein
VQPFLGIDIDIVGRALDYLADKANVIPGFRMFTIVLGVNPINMSSVDRSPANILRAVIEFIPGGTLITEALDNHGIIDKVAGWIAEQIKTLGLIGSSIKDALLDFVDSLGISDLAHLGDVWDRAKRIFTDPIDRIINFAKGLVSGIIKFIKDAILMPLAKLAEGTRGWDLLIAVLGKNPITGEAVPRTAETLIPGFLKLIGQEEVWANMKRARALPRAWAWFQGALSGLLGFVSQIPTLAINAFKSLELFDIVIVPRAFVKVAAVFGDFLVRFATWAGDTVWNLLEIIFDVVSPGAFAYVKRTGAALKSILKNPLPFVGNLVRAAKLGFQNFASNFGTHLKAGLIDWLTGSLPGVYIPKAFSFGELVKFVFSVLGLSWANVRQKLVKAIGETAVKALEIGFDIVVTLVREGPAAAWEKIQGQLSNLKDMVIGGITDFVIDTVKKKAIPKLLALFVPGAGFISAILSIYDTIMVFVNKLAKIAEVVKGFIDSIVAIAAGNIGAAAGKVESILAGLLSLAINFLAGFAGLGKVADKLMEVINKVRAVVDKALDWLVDWIVTAAKKLGRLVAQAGLPADPNERLRLGLQAAVAAARRLPGNKVGRVVLVPLLGAIKTRYGFTTLELEVRGGRWWVSGQINPAGAVDLEKVPEEEKVESGSDLYKIVRLLRATNDSAVLSEADADALRQSLSGLAKATGGAESTESAEKTAVKRTRDPDKPQHKWANLHGVLQAEWVEAQTKAIERLAAEVATGGDDPVLGLERGGALVAAQLAPGRAEGIAKPPPMADENIRRAEHIELLVQRINQIVAQNPGKELTITVAETWISGTAKNTLLARLEKLVAAQPNLTVRLLALRQTLGENVKRDQQGKLQEGQTDKRGRVTLTKADRLQLVWHTVPYIIGEDINYQNVPTGEGSKDPIIVFKGTDEALVAYQIVPVGEGTARDIILALVAGKISLPGVL